MKQLFEIENLRCSYDKNYREGASKVVLEIKSLGIPYGKKVFIVGESGIGKSTILEVLGLMNNTIVPDASSRFVFYDRSGVATSTYFLGGDVGQGVGPMVGGAILARIAGLAGYQAMFFLCAGLMLALMVYFYFFVKKENIR